MHITLITVGHIKTPSLAALAAEYEKRLRPLLKLEQETIKDSTLEKETGKVRSLLEKYPEEQVFLLDESSKTFTSVEFSSFLHKKTENGEHLIVVIAGAEGFADELKEKYQKISLSPMTFTHEFAQVIFLEQLYRAQMILSGKPYHKE